jgi:hypothetical protein
MFGQRGIPTPEGEASMTRIRSALQFALPLALLLGAAVMPPALAEDTEQPSNDGKAAVQVYKSGDKFIVAIYRQDGSAALALVEPPKSRGSGKAASRLDMADLMRNGRVVYTVNVAANDTPAAESTDETKPAGKPDKGAPAAKLTRKQRSDLIKRHRLAAGMMDAIGKGLANGAEVGAATLDANRAP